MYRYIDNGLLYVYPIFTNFNIQTDDNDDRDMIILIYCDIITIYAN